MIELESEPLYESTEIDFHPLDENTLELLIPMMGATISAGFPSPADDYLDEAIDLNRELVKNPSSTFLGRVKGMSMIDAGIFPQDILVVDKSLNVRDGDLVVSYLDGAFTLKRIKTDKNGVWLLPENENYKPIYITEENDFIIWGVVTYVIKKTRR